VVDLVSLLGSAIHDVAHHLGTDELVGLGREADGAGLFPVSVEGQGLARFRAEGNAEVDNPNFRRVSTYTTLPRMARCPVGGAFSGVASSLPSCDQAVACSGVGRSVSEAPGSAGEDSFEVWQPVRMTTDIRIADTQSGIRINVPKVPFR